MKLSDFNAILKGTRAIHRVPLPLVNTPAPFASDTPELEAQREKDGQSEQSIDVGIRVLTADDLLFVYEQAWKDAKARGAESPDEKDPLYALTLSVWTLALACVDPDMDPASPALFFGDTPAEAAKNIRSSPHLGRDGIAFLCEHHETWQDLVHPQGAKLNTAQMWGIIAEAASSDDVGPFLRLRPALRWILLRSTAALCVNLQLDKLPLGSPSETNTNGESNAASSA